MVALLNVEYDKMSDVQLAAQVAARDSAAAGWIVRRNNQRLFRIARSIVKSKSEAEDVVQAAYLSAFSAIQGFDGRSSLSTWLTRIAINEALGRQRAAKRRRALLDQDSILVIEEYREKLARGSMPSPPADAEIVRGELRQLLEGAIETLPPHFRTVFVLREIEGLSVEEVGEALGIATSTVKTRTYRARQILKRILDPEIKSALQGTFPFLGSACDSLTVRVLAAFAHLPFISSGEQNHD